MTVAAPTTYVVVCRGPNCRARGSAPLRHRLAELVRGLPATSLVGYACFGQCDFGPNVAFYPEGVWIGDLHTRDAADAVIAHAVHGAPPPGAPLDLPAADRQEHLANIAELVATLEQDRTRARRWWWPF
jgi:(2Fe-2S) ferredoxin